MCFASAQQVFKLRNIIDWLPMVYQMSHCHSGCWYTCAMQKCEQDMLTLLLHAADDADGSAHNRTSDAAAAPGGRDASAFTAPAAAAHNRASQFGTAALSAEPCRLRLALRMQRVSAIDAAVELGVDRCVAFAWQTDGLRALVLRAHQACYAARHTAASLTMDRTRLGR